MISSVFCTSCFSRISSSIRFVISEIVCVLLLLHTCAGQSQSRHFLGSLPVSSRLTFVPSFRRTSISYSLAIAVSSSRRTICSFTRSASASTIRYPSYPVTFVRYIRTSTGIWFLFSTVSIFSSPSSKTCSYDSPVFIGPGIFSIKLISTPGCSRNSFFWSATRSSLASSI